jgi:hypothetical protein
MEKIKNKQGIIRISMHYLREVDENYEGLKLLFSRFIPINISIVGFNYDVEYIGYSEEFEPLELGTIPPYYDAVFTSFQDGTIEMKFIKQ